MTDLAKRLNEIYDGANTGGVALVAVHLMLSAPGGWALHVYGPSTNPNGSDVLVLAGENPEELFDQLQDRVDALTKGVKIQKLRDAAYLLESMGDDEQAKALQATADKLDG